MNRITHWVVSLSLVVSVTGTARAVQGDGMVLYWSFDSLNGKTVEDESGNGRDGQLIAGGGLVDGVRGKALEVVAADEVQIIDDGALSGMEELTVEVWARMDIHQQTGLIQKGSGWGVDMSYLIQPWSDQMIYFGILNTGSRAISKPGDFPLGDWFHIAAVYDGATLELFVNGNSVSSAPPVAGVDGIPVSTQPLQLGNRFAGMVDDFILYERALSPDEIARDMNGEVLAVHPQGKLATRWASLKTTSLNQPLRLTPRP
ncbi:MAG: LamG domain-containing protein [Candidatus Poribacteria bacterium]|nr:LamG domain-containing protein [Candidatus Poribacteria bacterium]